MAENEEYYEPDIISVTDDDGNELLFELLERYETDNDVYVAITKYNETDEDIVDGDYEVITLKVETDDNGDEYLVEIEDEKLVFEHLLYAHFQKRTIEFPEFKGFDSFYVIPNKLIIVDSLSSNEIRDYARNEFKCVY